MAPVASKVLNEVHDLYLDKEVCETRQICLNTYFLLVCNVHGKGGDYKLVQYQIFDRLYLYFRPVLSLPRFCRSFVDEMIIEVSTPAEITRHMQDEAKSLKGVIAKSCAEEDEHLFVLNMVGPVSPSSLQSNPHNA